MLCGGKASGDCPDCKGTRPDHQRRREKGSTCALHQRVWRLFQARQRLMHGAMEDGIAGQALEDVEFVLRLGLAEWSSQNRDGLIERGVRITAVDYPEAEIQQEADRDNTREVRVRMMVMLKQVLQWRRMSVGAVRAILNKRGLDKAVDRATNENDALPCVLGVMPAHYAAHHGWEAVHDASQPGAGGIPFDGMARLGLGVAPGGGDTDAGDSDTDGDTTLACDGEFVQEMREGGEDGDMEESKRAERDKKPLALPWAPIRQDVVQLALDEAGGVLLKVCEALGKNPKGEGFLVHEDRAEREKFRDPDPAKVLKALQEKVNNIAKNVTAATPEKQEAELAAQSKSIFTSAASFLERAEQLGRDLGTLGVIRNDVAHLHFDFATADDLHRRARLTHRNTGQILGRVSRVLDDLVQLIRPEQEGLRGELQRARGRIGGCTGGEGDQEDRGDEGGGLTLWGMACRLDELRKEVITYLADHGQVPREG